MAFPDRRVHLRAHGGDFLQAIWRETIGVSFEIPFRADDVCRRDAPLRDGQTRPALRPRDRGRDRAHAELAVQGLRRRSGGSLPAVPQEYSRADLEKLEEFAKEWGAKGLAYIVYGEDGEARSPIAKFLSEDELGAFRAEPGTTVLFGADRPDQVARVLGSSGSASDASWGSSTRRRFAAALGDRLPDVRLVDEEDNGWAASHHPFTRHRRPGPSRCSRRIPAGRSRSPTTSSPTAMSSGSGSLRIHRVRAPGESLRHPAHSPEEQKLAVRFPARRP